MRLRVLFSVLLGVVFFASAGAADNSLTFVREFGVPPHLPTPGGFDIPFALAVDPASGDVYVVDEIAGTVQRFGVDGTFHSQLPLGAGVGELLAPNAIAVDCGNGNVYVSDPDLLKIVEFQPNGTFIREFDYFGNPTGLAVDPTSHDLFVADVTGGVGTVKRLTATGAFVSQLDATHVGTPDALALDCNSSVLFVSDEAPPTSFIPQIEEFHLNGTFIRSFGSFGTGAGELEFPVGIAVDSVTHDVFVADFTNGNLQRFARDGTFLTQFASPGTSPGQLSLPGAVAFDSSIPKGTLFAGDWNRDKVLEFQTDTGAQLQLWLAASGGAKIDVQASLYVGGVHVGDATLADFVATGAGPGGSALATLSIPAGSVPGGAKYRLVLAARNSCTSPASSANISLEFGNAAANSRLVLPTRVLYLSGPTGSGGTLLANLGAKLLVDRVGSVGKCGQFRALGTFTGTP